MASITIRNLNDSVKKRLRKQAAEHGRSLEAEVRAILDRASHDAEPQRIMNGLELFRPLREVVEKYGGVELELPERTPVRASDAPSKHKSKFNLHRDKSGTFAKVRSDTRVDTLRATYGDQLASGVRSDTKLSSLLHSKSSAARQTVTRHPRNRQK